MIRQEKTDLLREVEVFEDGKNQEEEFEWRRGIVTVLDSSVGLSLRSVTTIFADFSILFLALVTCFRTLFVLRGTKYGVNNYKNFLFQHKQLR